MIPIASFNFQINFLGVFFTDTSENFPTSWNWQFGDASSSTDRNPNHTYAAPGSYTVTFTVTNVDGSDTHIFIIDVTDQPIYGYTIDEIVAEERPSTVLVDNVYEDQRKRYWMLHLQILIEPKISDAFVFDETKWPNLVKILIAKLVVHDLLLRLAREAMSKTLAQVDQQNANTITVVQDGNTFSFVGTSATLTAPSGADTYQWTRNAVAIAGANSETYIATLAGTYVCNMVTGVTPTTEGPIVITFSNTIVQTSTGSGGLKSIETGPSKVEWYDSSESLSQIFKPSGGKSGDLSVFDELLADVCIIASRLRIKLPMCKPLSHNTIIPRKVGRNQPDSLQKYLSKYGWTE